MSDAQASKTTAPWKVEVPAASCRVDVPFNRHPQGLSRIRLAGLHTASSNGRRFRQYASASRPYPGVVRLLQVAAFRAFLTPGVCILGFDLRV